MSVEPSHDICVIIPTIRDYECLETYVENAQIHGFDRSRLFFLLITEDFCETAEMEALLDATGVDGHVFDGTRRERWYAEQAIEEYSHVIPAASHAETSFGLLYMWANPEFEYGIFIDDDTLPHPEENYFGRHLANLKFTGSIESVQSDQHWVNVLYQRAADHGLYPRGYPYGAMNESIETATTEITRGEIVASQGLWTNVPDLDAVRILMDGDLDGQAQTHTTKDDFTHDFVAASDNYLTVCSMNLAFRRKVIPAFYQLPMDDNDWNIGRFDDIWSGVFLKRVCDVLGYQIYNGRPLCQHNKAPRSTFDDLANEAPALELNEYLWQLIDDAGSDATDFAEAYQALANRLQTVDADEYQNGDFLAYLGALMADWVACLDALERVPAVELAD